MSGRVGIEGLRDDLRRQRAVVAERAPSYDRILEALLALLDTDAALEERLANALRGRSFFAHYDRPLLILAALRLDAILDGPAHPLYPAIAAPVADASAVTTEAVAAATTPDRSRFFETIATRYVQTNETGRAVAWLWPAALAGCSEGKRPLALVDIGASAGLNLVADALPAKWTDESGNRLPTVHDARIVARLGLDARPLDASRPEDAAWLRACIWPGDTARLERLEAALDAWHATPARMEALDISDTPARIATLLNELPPDTLLLAYQTVVREYLPPDLYETYRAAMHRLIAATPAVRLAWLELETAPPPATPERPAALTAHVRGPDGTEVLELARSHWHPSVLTTNADAVTRFVRLLAP